MAKCVFCSIARGELPADVVHETDDTIAFLDIKPLFHGHVLVVPREHHVTLGELPPALVPKLFAVAQLLSVAVEGAMGAQGTFVAMNNRVSQSVPHLHVHVVPRTKGDGLKGFFWPRHAYADEAERAAVAARIRELAEPAARR
jgi:histidine triad (HIT) family protein